MRFFTNILKIHICKYACSCSVLLTQYCAGDKIEESEMGGACSA